MNKTIALSIIFLIGCGAPKTNVMQFRNQQYGALYSDKEKIDFTFSKAEKSFKYGKARVRNDQLLRAKTEYNFLITHYDHNKSKQRLIEIEDYYMSHKKFYKDLLKKSLKKKWIFTSAGYYKKLQKLFPTDPEALAYQTKFKTEIKKRLNYNLSQGLDYVKKKKYNKAKRCFNRVLVFNPKSKSANNGLAKIKKAKKAESRRLTVLKKKKSRKNKRKNKKTSPKTTVAIAPVTPEITLIEEIEQLPPEEMEKIYLAGINSYESKDFTKAYELFEALKDSLYKDTNLYLERTQDKIDALGLDE